MKKRFTISYLFFLLKFTPVIAQQMVIQMGHMDKVTSLVLSADNKTLVSSSDDNTIKVWEFGTGLLLRTLQGHEGKVESIALSKNGKTLVSGSHDKMIKVWEVETGRLLRTIKGSTREVTSVALSTDGKTLLSSSWDGTIKVWELATGLLLNTIEGHNGAVLSIILSGDGKTLVSAGIDQTIKIWELATGQLLRTIQGLSRYNVSIALSGDGKTLVYRTEDETIKVWEIATGRLMNTIEGHTYSLVNSQTNEVYSTGINGIESLAVSRDGKTVASGSDRKTIKVLNLETGELLHLLEGDAASLTFSHDGKTLISGGGLSDRSIKAWEIGTGRLLRSFDGYTGDVTLLTISGEGSILASNGRKDTIKVWDIPTGRQLRIFKGDNDNGIITHDVTSLLTSKDGKLLIAGIYDNIKIWDLGTGQLLKTFDDTHRGAVESLALSNNNKLLVSCGSSIDKTIKVWDISTGQLLHTLEGHSGSMNHKLVFSGDGKILVSSSGLDTIIKVWNAETGQLLRTIQEHSYGVEDLALSGDGKILISAGVWDSRVYMWELSTGRLLRTLEGHIKKVNVLALSGDSKTLVSGSSDQTIKVWELATGQLLRTLEGHKGWLNSIAFSADGKTLVSSSQDKTIKMWDIELGIELFTLLDFEANDYLTLTNSGLYDGSPLGLKRVHYVDNMNVIERPQNDSNYLPDLAIKVRQYPNFIFKYWQLFQNDKKTSVLFAQKDEFESQDIYQKRLQRAKAFEEELIAKYHKRYELDSAKQAQVLRQIIKDSYKQITLKIDTVGAYEADRQFFIVTINQRQDTLRMPLASARSFKENWQQAKVTADQQLDDKGKTIWVYNIQVYHPITQVVYPFGLQRSPLFLDFLPQTPVVEEMGIPRLTAQVELEEPSGNRLLDTKEDAKLKVVIKNEGKGTARNVITLIDWVKFAGLSLGKVDTIKSIAPGASATVYISLQASLYIETSTVGLNLSFQEEKGFPPAPINMRIGTQGLKPPALTFVEAGIFEEEGNNNNIIENQEVIKVSAIIRNNGELPAENVKVSLLVGDANIVVLQTSKFPLQQTIDILQPKEQKIVQFVFSVNYRYKGGDDLPLQLQVLESFKNVTLNFPLGLKMKVQSLAAKDVTIAGNYGLLGIRKDRALFFAVADYTDNTLDLTNPILDAEKIAKELRERYSFETEVVANPTYDEIDQKIREYERLYKDNPQNRYHPAGQLLIFFTGHGEFVDGSGYFLPKDVDSKRISRTAFAYPIWKPIIDKINCDHILVAIDACYSGTFDEEVANKSGGNDSFGRPNENPKDRIILDHLNYKSRYYLTSGAKVETPDKSKFAKQFLEGLINYRPQNGIFNALELFTNYLSKATPSPLQGDFGSHQPGGSFLFIAKE